MFKTRKFAATATAGLMALSAMGFTSVFASGDQATATDNISVTLNNTESVYGPAGTVKFTVTAQNADDSLYEGLDFHNAPNGGIYNAEALFTPGQHLTKESTASTNLVINPTAFENQPLGIYKYNVQATTNIDGVSLTNDSHVVYVIKSKDVENNDTFTLVVPGENGLTKCENLAVSGTYTTHTLTVTKVIQGNQATKGESFNFTADLAPDNSNDKFVVNGNTAVSTSYTTDLTNGGKFTISGLSATDAVVISESYGTHLGFKTDITGAEKAGVPEEGQDASTKTFNVNSEKTVTFKNIKEGTIPTGIILSAAPYAGMIGLGGLFAGVFFRKKRED